MLFTIAIPTYNNASTIEKTIKSCLNQNYRDNYEVLVVNNSCTDGTSKILDFYRDRISIVENEFTVSLFENHNVCIKHAKGDYVIFCHADDQLLPDALTKYYTILEKRNFPLRYVLWGRSMFRDFYANWKNAGFYLNEIASGINSLDVFFGGGLTPSGTCYSRESFEKHGGFIPVDHKLGPSDLVTLLKLSLNHFEFEMVDRIFFNREFASTASGSSFSYSAQKESIADAIKCLRLDIGEDKFDVLLGKIRSTANFSPFLFNILIEYKYFKGSDFRRRLFKEILRNPFCISNREIRKMLFA